MQTRVPTPPVPVLNRLSPDGETTARATVMLAEVGPDRRPQSISVMHRRRLVESTPTQITAIGRSGRNQVDHCYRPKWHSSRIPFGSVPTDHRPPQPPAATVPRPQAQDSPEGRPCSAVVLQLHSPSLGIHRPSWADRCRARANVDGSSGTSNGVVCSSCDPSTD